MVRGSVSPDHVHMLLSAPPQLAPAKLVQFIKGRSSRKLQEDRVTKAVLGAAPMGTRILLVGAGIKPAWSYE
jgi:REP element-mobilizing transposase RayT